MASNGNGKKNWYAFASLLAGGVRSGEAAAQLGIPSRTASRWINEDEDFIALVNQLRDRAIHETSGLLADNARKATQKLGSLLESESEKVQLQAARSTLEFAFRSRDSEELFKRLVALEKKIKGYHAGSESLSDENGKDGIDEGD